MKILILAFLIIVFGIFGGWNVFQEKNVTKAPIKIIVTPNPQQNNLVMPILYPNLSWLNQGAVSSKSGVIKIAYSKNSSAQEIALSGTKWTAKKDKLNYIGNLNVQSEFRDYYNKQFAKLGWGTSFILNGYTVAPVVVSKDRETQWGYIKEVNGKLRAIILQINAQAVLIPKDQKVNCPCTVNFSIFYSSTLDIKDILFLFHGE